MSEDKKVHLTSLSTKGGCAAKWPPDALKGILEEFVPAEASEVMLGFETSDDAAVYRLNDDLAAVLTIDFLTPLVDDPFEFGRIAAANALSDIFAMGARPLTALNVLALSVDLGAEVARQILAGGASAVTEAGAFVVGGHTIEDEEPKYGLSVFGTVHPQQIIRNAGARAGDLLYLTKPLGTGLLTAAHRVGRETDESIRPAVESMMRLNNHAAQAMIEAKAHAATDITGFGLAGHLHEMLVASSCSAVLNWESIPLFESVWEHSCAYCRPAKSFSNADYAEAFVEQGFLDDDTYDNRMGVLCDPQTSGGLLIALAPDQADRFTKHNKELSGLSAWCIGEICEGDSGIICMR